MPVGVAGDVGETPTLLVMLSAVRRWSLSKVLLIMRLESSRICVRWPFLLADEEIF